MRIWWITIKWIVVMKIQPSICLNDWGKPRKTPVRLVGTGIWTRASRMRVSCVTTEPPRSVRVFCWLWRHFIMFCRKNGYSFVCFVSKLREKVLFHFMCHYKQSNLYTVQGRMVIGISGSLIWSKTLKELIFNPCGECRWRPEGPVSQIHSPHLLVGATGTFQIF